jgi:glycosyltransferase involved in cell wall biosynthesis
MTGAKRIAFVAPRFPEGPTVGGAETLLRALALRAAARGREVTFLTTCARNHFTWKNEVPPGEKSVGSMRVRFFPVAENRDVETFLRIQEAISRRSAVTPDEEVAWLANSVNSPELQQHLLDNAESYDRVVAGPYLFGLTCRVAMAMPAKTVLVPCLHDEPFAYVRPIAEMFRAVGRFMFNSEPERDLAIRLYDVDPKVCSVVGIGLDAFESDPSAFAASRGITCPYVFYCGRREPLKGTPLLLDYINAFRTRTARDVKLVLAGTGQVDVPAGLERHLIDAGFLSETDKHNAMAGATAFCHPSLNESLSIVLLESWLAGTPALVHDKSEVMRDQCRRSGGGLWFRNYPEFEEELLILIDDSALRERLAASGREYVRKRYSWNRVEKEMLSALDTDAGDSTVFQKM